MTPRFHPAAEMELAAAVNVGETRGWNLGAELLRESRRVIDLLCEQPLIGEPVDADRRRFPLKRFPFGIVYRVDGDALRILAFAHRRQRPKYWRKRT